MRRYADANVFLRYLLGDVPKQAEKAREAINDGVWLSEAVLAEVVYVLNGVYEMPRSAIAGLLVRLLDEVTSENKMLLKTALELYGTKRKLDFVDCLLVARKRVIADDEVFTFDKDLKKEMAAK